MAGLCTHHDGAIDSLTADLGSCGLLVATYWF